MKKLIGIGVALVLLAMVVVPVGVAAQSCNYTYGTDPIVTVEPATYAKIPFAILESGLGMLANVMGELPSELGIPSWLPSVVLVIAPWTGGPLSWTVDMLAWGLDLVALILNQLGPTLGLPLWVDDLVSGIACGLFTPFECQPGGATFTPCSPL